MTSLEVQLYEIPEIYAGVLFFPWERSSEVLHAWNEWTADRSGRGHLGRAHPPVPAAAGAAGASSAARTSWSSRPSSWAARRPARSCCGRCASSGRRSTPSRWCRRSGSPSCTWTRRTPCPTRVRATCWHRSRRGGRRVRRGRGPDVGLAARLCGDPAPRRRATRSAPHHGALATFDAPYLTFGLGMVFDDETTVRTARSSRSSRTRSPRTTPAGSTSTSPRTQTDPARFYTPEAYRRLRAVKASVDPENVFRANHPIPAGRLTDPRAGEPSGVLPRTGGPDSSRHLDAYDGGTTSTGTSSDVP